MLRFQIISYRALSGPLAQLVEHLTFNQGVEGSNPSGPTNADAGLQDIRTYSSGLHRNIFRSLI